MSLETVAYINDLNIANPTSSDPKSAGDDHIRNIKTALKECLNGFTGAILLTGTDVGAVNAYVITPTTALVAYTAGLLVLTRPVNANTAACTINISGLGVRSIKTARGADPTSGDIAANQPILLMYDGTNFVLIGGSAELLRTGNQTLTGNLTLTGSETISGTLGVTGATTVGSTLDVTGAATVGGTLGVTGNVTMGGTLAVTGTITSPSFAAKADLASPVFTGNPTAPTPSVGDADTSIATTAFVATSFAPLASPALTGIPTAPTAAAGTATTQIATMAAVAAAAFSAALPGQTGNSGKFVTTDGTNASWAAVYPSQTGNSGKYLTTNGTTTAWATAGVGTINAAVTTSTTLTASNSYVPVAMSSLGQSVTLPSAVALTAGGLVIVIDNTLGGYPAGIRDNAGTLITAVKAGGEVVLSLKTAGTQAGVWSYTGDTEPGLITVDSTFSSTYASTVLAPFVALDNNTSIHFAKLASGFAAFVVDNAGKVLTTPVTVDATANSVPRTIFKIDATRAILFFASSSLVAKAVVLTLSGSSPSFTLTVGTAQQVTLVGGMNALWYGEDFIGAPVIVQLSSTLYLAAYTDSGTPALVCNAFSVSGSTVTIGATATISAASVISTQNGSTYALTATTALVIYKSGAAAPYNNNAVVVSVSGTTCTVGTPVALTTNTSSATSPASCALLSATKCIVADDGNSVGLVYASAVTVSGATVTVGTALMVDNFAGTLLPRYSDSSATRYNPHLWAIGANTAGLWYLDSANVSRVVILSESAGTLTKGTILYNSISLATGTNGAGAVMGMSGTDLLGLRNDAAGSSTTNNKKLVPHKLSGTSVTCGASAGVPTSDLTAGVSVTSYLPIRLTSGDYVFGALINGSGIANSAIPVIRSNGDFINYRGSVKCPALNMPSNLSPAQAVASNRVVILGSTNPSSSTIDAYTTFQLRLLNVEIAA